MTFATSSFDRDAKWRTYKHLELIPESVSNPSHPPHPLVSGLNVFWRPLLALLIEELVAEQRIEYLSRCWLLDEFNQPGPSLPNSLRRLWVLME